MPSRCFLPSRGFAAAASVACAALLLLGGSGVVRAAPSSVTLAESDTMATASQSQQAATSLTSVSESKPLAIEDTFPPTSSTDAVAIDAISADESVQPPMIPLPPVAWAGLAVLGGIAWRVLRSESGAATENRRQR